MVDWQEIKKEENVARSIEKEALKSTAKTKAKQRADMELTLGKEGMTTRAKANKSATGQLSLQGTMGTVGLVGMTGGKRKSNLLEGDEDQAGSHNVQEEEEEDM